MLYAALHPLVNNAPRSSIVLLMRQNDEATMKKEMKK
jgi:hypothetical protein